LQQELQFSDVTARYASERWRSRTATNPIALIDQLENLRKTSARTVHHISFRKDMKDDYT